MSKGNPGRGWKWMLWGAAAYNWLVSLPVLIDGQLAAEAKISAVLVAGFGLLYALVARDPVRLAPALWAGVAGKLGLVVLLAPSVASGTAAPGTGPVLAGDLVFTAAFLALLLGPARGGR
ncbi:hypothetical protein [Novosphingobium sp.]|uniref:hypothetical protein n=1 Tax=Novosphingobium sp. TaxID=1874826 RepID=UPI0022BFBC05|nr:hypothetical protein [Novosphingobium sp.]MCZ8019266.1 hypothetical protein [Novosphingobium sp.]MCZ8035081.1 hypothetical protein [Novosphingobium sp.]MCZ8050395.1 hypothetical protein [Novosphingobium sp.]MCZ8058741.1 hypothetical protein [Novosphingobium sp.]MCZ8232186.1 hypothetical protein [Novosphingobium sp.]